MAQIAGSTAVVSGVLFGVMQLRHLRAQRQAVAAAELVHSFRGPEFNRALRLLWNLPDGITAAQIRSSGSAVEEAAVFVGMTLESVGVLVYRRLVSIEILDDLMGDAVVGLWRKLEPWVAEMRREQNRDSVYEWFQWLAERLGERERRHERGAHRRHERWRP